MVFDKGSVTSSSCPKCHQIDRVQKVSAIVDAGTATGGFTGPTSGYIHGREGGYVSGNIALFGSTRTYLSHDLSLPYPRPYKSAWGCVIFLMLLLLFAMGGGFLAGAIVVVVQTAVNNQQYMAAAVAIGAVMFIFSLPFFFLVVKLIQSRRKEASSRRALYENDKLRWGTARDRWYRLYYCERDDGVFDPADEESGLIPRAQMLGFLYS